MSSLIKINGVSYKGNSIIANNSGEIIIDGVSFNFDSKVINIEITGNIDRVELKNSGTVNVTGNVNEVRTANGDINIGGDAGTVQTTNGDVDIKGKVLGNVKTTNGDITHSKF